LAALLEPMFTGPTKAIVVSVGMSVDVPAAPAVRFTRLKETEGTPEVTRAPLLKVNVLLPRRSSLKTWVKAAPSVRRLRVREVAKLEVPLKM